MNTATLKLLPLYLLYVYKPMDNPDTRYIDALLTNNEKLLRELYDKCFGKIRKFVVQNNGTEEDAWDVLQDAMLAVYFKIKNKPFTLTCPFDAFIYIVCKNLWIKQLRKKHGARVTIDPETVLMNEESALIGADECVREQGRRSLLLEKLNELGEGCRELLQQNWRGASLDEVAASLKISYAYVRKRKSQCMAKLILLIRQSPLYDQLKQ
jgi:RNA polymerase sigma factor (sigma-70 family)